tara:strand:+ start:481 stop:1635 length:1155 start_codon:yes stop_codon:yes gene_type:complete
MYNINGFYLKKNIEKIQENYENNKLDYSNNSINITIDTSLFKNDDKQIVKTQVLNSIDDAGSKVNKFNLINEISKINVYDSSEAYSNKLIWTLPSNVNISKKDICKNSGFIYEDDICYKTSGKREIVDIEINNLPKKETSNNVVDEKEIMCSQIAKYGFYYNDGKCFNPTGEPITFESNEGTSPSPLPSKTLESNEIMSPLPSNLFEPNKEITPYKIEEFKNNENNTTVEITYSQFPNESTNFDSNIANAIAKSGNIPLSSIGDPVLIEAPSIEENIPFPNTDPDYYLLNKFDDKEMKIITDVTFFNKKLQNLSANDISNIITSICNKMNENCEVIFFENFDNITKGEFLIKLKNKNKLNLIKKKLITKLKSLNIHINHIKILK